MITQTSVTDNHMRYVEILISDFPFPVRDWIMKTFHLEQNDIFRMIEGSNLHKDVCYKVNEFYSNKGLI